MFLQQPFAHAREEERCCVDRSKSERAAATMKGGAGGGARLDRDRGQVALLGEKADKMRHHSFTRSVPASRVAGA